MGPRFFERGNLMSPETLSRSHSASMGPRFFERGNELEEGDFEGDVLASMGPRFFERGNNPIKQRLHQLRRRFNGAALF